MTSSTRRPSRRAPVDRLRRWTQAVLVAGSVLALAATAGPVWVVRVGVVVAVATGVLACALAWRETFGERRRHASERQRSDRTHAETLSTERRRNAEVVDALTERLRSSGMVVAGLRAQNGHLTEQLRERDGLLGLFRTSLREQEAALLAVREAETRRPPRSEESVLDPEMVELAMVLPNYEATRRAG